MYLDHFQIFPIYGENMVGDYKNSQCCTRSRYLPYMGKIWKGSKNQPVLHRSRYLPYVTSHAKTYTNGFPFLNGNPFTSRLSAIQKKFASVRTAWLIRSEKNHSRSNGSGHPFKTFFHPFEQLVPSVQKKFASFRTA